MADVASRLAKCFSAVFPDLPPEEIAAATPASVPAWDSIANVMLVNVVEEEFATTIDLDALEHLDSFAALADYLEKRTD